MSSSLFFSNALPAPDTLKFRDLLYSDGSALLAVAERLANGESIRAYQLPAILNRRFPWLASAIKANQYKALCINTFSWNSSKELSGLHGHAADINREYQISKQIYLEAQSKSHDTICGEITSSISAGDYPYSKAVGLNAALLRLSGEVEEEQVTCLMFAALWNYASVLPKTANSLSNISLFFSRNEAERFFSSNPGSVLFQYGFKTIEAIRKADPSVLLSLCAFHEEELVKQLHLLEEMNIESLRNSLLDIYEKLDSKSLSIWKRRLGLVGEKKTLEQVGTEYGVTRERIRQLEARVVTSLRNDSCLLLKNKFCTLFHKEKCNEGFLSESRLSTLLLDKDAALCMRLIIEANPPETNDDICFDEKLSIYYSGGEDGYEKVLESILKGVPSVVTEYQLSGLWPMQVNAIKNSGKYKRDQSGNYRLAGLRKRSGYLEVVEELFPDGYKIYSDEHYRRFSDGWKAKYGSAMPIPTATSLRGAIGEHWQLVDDGTYLPRERCPSVPKDLVPAIYDFIESLLPAVYYRSIYYEFEDRLLDAGISNPAMFKGAFDIIDNRYKHARDYLKSFEWSGTCYDAILKYASELEGIFNTDSLREHFPHIEDYVFYFCLDKQPNIVHLFNEYFLWIDESTFKKQDLTDLASFIDKYLSLNKIDSISCTKLYEKLRFADTTELLQRLQYVINENALIAIVKACLNDKFDTTYNYIGRKGKTAENKWDAFTEFISGADDFTKADIGTVASKYGFSSNYTFADVINLASKTHVQVSKDQMIRKTKLNLDDSEIMEIGAALRRLMEAYNEINTKTFNRYFLLPPIPNHKWNKYLLAGIVRGYFSSGYQVVTTDGDYRITDFIIRRKNG